MDGEADGGPYWGGPYWGAPYCCEPYCGEPYWVAPFPGGGYEAYAGGCCGGVVAAWRRELTRRATPAPAMTTTTPMPMATHRPVFPPLSDAATAAGCFDLSSLGAAAGWEAGAEGAFDSAAARSGSGYWSAGPGSPGSLSAWRGRTAP